MKGGVWKGSDTSWAVIDLTMGLGVFNTEKKRHASV